MEQLELARSVVVVVVVVVVAAAAAAMPPSAASTTASGDLQQPKPESEAAMSPSQTARCRQESPPEEKRLPKTHSQG
jgi:hypothetical protein